MTLLVCKTCPRYDIRRNGEFARELLGAIADAGHHVPIRSVHCLAGCPDDGVIALHEPGKTRVRFTGLIAADAEAIVAAARRHADSVTGDPKDWAVPLRLARRSASTRPPIDGGGS